ncbi:MAG: hypothetical protein FJ276_05260 [Planctomycetes bacterium]|nr:hypothetical protein [Planctomycetota bacterium]
MFGFSWLQPSGFNMDLFDFFFPEQAQAAHLRKIAARQSLGAPASSSVTQRDDDISALKSDVRFLTLVLTAILKRLTETQTMSLADVQDLLDEVDALDGIADCGLEPEILRGLLGVLKQGSETKPDSGSDVFAQIAELHRRYRK